MKYESQYKLSLSLKAEIIQILQSFNILYLH